MNAINDDDNDQRLIAKMPKIG